MTDLLLEGEKVCSITLEGGVDSDGRYWVIEEMISICRDILFENKVDLSDAPEICLNGNGRTEDNREPDDREMERRKIRKGIRDEKRSVVKKQWASLERFTIGENTAIPSSFFGNTKSIGTESKRSISKLDPFREQTQKTNDMVESKVETKVKKAFAQTASCLRDPFKDQNCGECSRLSCQNNIARSEDAIREMSEDSFWD